MSIIYNNNLILGSGGSGGGISEAPIDGDTYGRKDATWVKIEGNFLSQTKFFTNADLIGGVLKITHTINTENVLVAVYNNLKNMVIPDEISIVDFNNIAVDFKSFTIDGEWKVVIQGLKDDGAGPPFTAKIVNGELVFEEGTSEVPDITINGNNLIYTVSGGETPLDLFIDDKNLKINI